MSEPVGVDGEDRMKTSVSFAFILGFLSSVVTFGEVLQEVGYPTEPKSLAAVNPDLTWQLASRWRA